MKIKSLIASSIILALSACNDSDISPEVGSSPGSVTLSGDAIVGSTLSATVSDNDGLESAVIVYQWMADDKVISGATSASYMLIEADVDSTITVSVTYTDDNGHNEMSKSAPSDTVEIPAVPSVGKVTISGNAYEGHILTATVIDTNGSDATAIVYTWMVDGSDIADETVATYTLTAADLGSTITVTATYTDFDDFEEQVTSTATNVVVVEPIVPVEPIIPMTQAAAITDTMGIGDLTPDSGELRFILSDQNIEPLTAGKMMVSFRKEAGAVNNNPDDNETDNKDAYIGLFGSKVGTGYELVELRIQEGVYVIRGQEGTVDVNADSVGDNATFTGDEWVDIEITWDALNASDSVAPLITLAINGTAVTVDAFPTYNSEKSDGTLGTHFETIMAGVQHMVFKIGDNDATIATAFYIDNIKLYSDTAGTAAALVFEDDFEAPTYAVGDSLDSDNIDSPYNSNTNEAVVAEVVAAADPVVTDPVVTDPVVPDPVVPDPVVPDPVVPDPVVPDPVVPDPVVPDPVVPDPVVPDPVVPDPVIVNLQAAAITDTMGVGDLTKDTGELRFKLSDESIDPITAGKMTVSFRKEAGAVNNNPNDTDTDNKDAYIGLFGSKIGTGYELIELRVQEGTYVIRGQEGTVDVNAASVGDNATFTGTEWVDLEITWDATNASDSVAPLMTLTINGTAVSASAFSTYNSGKTDSTYGTHFATIMAGVQALVFKIGDNDATIATSFYIDDIKLYSDTAGTTLVFSDDFELPAYVVGASLDTDNVDSPYNSSTNEAVVVDRL